jgi:RimJ/RimL family protein N-acetyltransferase
MSAVLLTERLALRELLPSDLDFVASMLGDADTMRFYPRPYTREESAAWIDRQRRRYASDGHALWLVMLREAASRWARWGWCGSTSTASPRTRSAT